jgi:dihydropyrimidine dehydrogenase (NAD+) subunit PreA
MDRRPNLEIDFCNFLCENPFFLAASPIARDGEMIERAFKMGWGGAITKSVAFEQDTPDYSLSPRFAKIKNGGSNNCTSFRKIGMANIDFRIDKSLKDTLDSYAKVKRKYPNKFLAVSIKVQYQENLWEKMAILASETGADAIELCLSCPDSTPNDSCNNSCNNLNISIGQSKNGIQNILRWVRKVTNLPIIVKLSPNVTDIRELVISVEKNGAKGVTLVNSMKGFSGFDLIDSSPFLNIEGKTSIAGMTGPILKPLTLYYTHEVKKMKNIYLDISAAGGITCAYDAIEYLLIGARSLQIATEVMWEGYRIIEQLTEGLVRYMKHHNIKDISHLVGKYVDKIEQSCSSLSRAQQLYANINQEECIRCGKCYIACRDGGYQAIKFSKDRTVEVEKENCAGCGLCKIVCPVQNAIYFKDKEIKEADC